MLATLAQMKARYGVSGSGDDATITSILRGVSDQIAQACDRVAGARPALEMVDLIETLTVPERNVRMLMLAAYPVVEITEIKEALYGAFTDADGLLEGDDYQVNSGSGVIYRISYWLAGRLTVRVTYTGGYTVGIDEWTSGSDYSDGDLVQYQMLVYAADGDITGSVIAPPADTDHWTVEAGQVALPRDLEEAALQQAGFTWQRRASLGLASQSVQGGSVSAYAQDTLLPGVRDVAARYRRMMG